MTNTDTTEVPLDDPDAGLELTANEHHQTDHIDAAESFAPRDLEPESQPHRPLSDQLDEPDEPHVEVPPRHVPVEVPADVATDLLHSREIGRRPPPAGDDLDERPGNPPAARAKDLPANGGQAADPCVAVAETRPGDRSTPAGRMVTPYIATPVLVVVVAIVAIARPSLGLTGLLLLAGSVPPMTLITAELVSRGWRP